MFPNCISTVGWTKKSKSCQSQKTDPPQNPQKATLGTKIGPRKVVFSHFLNFFLFPIEFSIVVEKNYSPWEGKVLEQKQK